MSNWSVPGANTDLLVATDAGVEGVNGVDTDAGTCRKISVNLFAASIPCVSINRTNHLIWLSLDSIAMS